MEQIIPEHTFNSFFLGNKSHYERNNGRDRVCYLCCTRNNIACGGLSAFGIYTSLRTRDRCSKVLGASVGSVVMLLTKDFSKLILIAFVLSVPASWYVMDKWLNGFAYHIEMGPGIFLIAGAASLFIAWITVSYQSIKAAIVNPINSLRRAR